MSDREILRRLAGRYAEIAFSDNRKDCFDRGYRTTRLQLVRPLVVTGEHPWNELDCPALRLACADPFMRGVELRMRRLLYCADVIGDDHLLPKWVPCPRAVSVTPLDISVDERRLALDEKSSVVSHEYHDMLPDEEALAKLSVPTVRHDAALSEVWLQRLDDAFGDIIKPCFEGLMCTYSAWDRIAELRGVEALLTDLVDRPQFTHQIVRRFTDIQKSLFEQYERLGLLGRQFPVLCTFPMASDELRGMKTDAPDVKRGECWGRTMAQIFASVSPEMHREFEFDYASEVYAPFGLFYYGCCEPLDRKIGLLKSMFPNLRKISITPWADVESAAEQMGGRYVLSYKPNPAFVNSPHFDPAPVQAELRRVASACKRHGTPLEFTLKDISTVGYRPQNLPDWMAAARQVLEEEF